MGHLTTELVQVLKRTTKAGLCDSRRKRIVHAVEELKRGIERRRSGAHVARQIQMLEVAQGGFEHALVGEKLGITSELLQNEVGHLRGSKFDGGCEDDHLLHELLDECVAL